MWFRTSKFVQGAKAESRASQTNPSELLRMRLAGPRPGCLSACSDASGARPRHFPDEHQWPWLG
jgi:hypothetical protein